MDLRVGIDLIEVERVRESLLVHGRRYVARMCTEAEARECADGESFDPRGIAARVAAKEAVFKALRPVGDALPWRSVEVLADGRAHALRLSGPAADRARAAGLQRWNVSISHASGYVSAVVTADGGAS
jgi:holo-[acyl-carrier protein] synthase